MDRVMQRTAIRSIQNTLSHASFLSFWWFFFKIKTETQIQEQNKNWYQEEESKKNFFYYAPSLHWTKFTRMTKKKILYGFIIRIKILLLHSFWTFQNTLQNFSTLSCRYISLHVVCNGKRMYSNTFIINI